MIVVGRKELIRIVKLVGTVRKYFLIGGY